MRTKSFTFFESVTGAPNKFVDAGVGLVGAEAAVEPKGLLLGTAGKSEVANAPDVKKEPGLEYRKYT